MKNTKIVIFIIVSILLSSILVIKIYDQINSGIEINIKLSQVRANDSHI
ncbi:hypothetical protein [Helicovermis profundi]|uniref:Uncharacterized protein n=1 Tax=Helicovermis profundi TaxID=3065157 RepID=A0AAU9EMN4_9FIRM|nr:hypothetical protein HLPR_08670 [Clostridia bacterium S502]